MAPALIIAKKRDGRALSSEEIHEVVQGATTGAWADYQLSAWLMAVYWRGMDLAETAFLTEAMMRSGTIVDLSEVARPKVDKHSTGGVGDKISLVLAPMVAACGGAVPMVSGRGLGHTGGTLDKLESIPGFRIGLSLAEYRAQIASIGVALIGATQELAPADRKLYALRDVTATVESIPLICASILSKKLAEGIDALVLDVKFGEGAFMPTLAKARELARALVEVATKLGKPTCAVLTEMEEPLGRTVGNALEVAESIECLRGHGPEDVMAVTFALGEQMLTLTKLAPDEATARKKLQESIATGSALAKWREIILTQGGDVGVVDDSNRLPQAKFVVPVLAQHDGLVQRVAARPLALAALALGAGRTRAEEKVDPSVGISRLVKRGESIAKGAALAWVHAASEKAAQAAGAAILTAIEIGTKFPPPRPLIADVIR